MAKTKYTDRLASLAEMLKDEPMSVPIQEVRPVAAKAAQVEQAKINGFWVPVDLARQVKLHAAATNQTIREIAIEALEAYFKAKQDT